MDVKRRVSVDHNLRSMWHSPGCCGRQCTAARFHPGAIAGGWAADGGWGWSVRVQLCYAARAAPRPDPRQFLLRRLGRRMGETGARHGHSQHGLVAGADELHGTRIPRELLSCKTNVASKTTKNLTDFDALIAWSFNRRLMLEITGAYQWTDPRTGLGRERRHSRTGGPSSIDRHRIVVLFLQFQGRRAESGAGGNPDHVQLRRGRIRGPGLLVRLQTSRAVLQLFVRQFRRAGRRGHQAQRRRPTTLPWPRPSPTRKLRFWAI